MLKGIIIINMYTDIQSIQPYVVCCLATQNLRPISLDTEYISDHKVARVGRLATDYMIVVRPWEVCMHACTHNIMWHQNQSETNVGNGFTCYTKILDILFL